MSGGPETRFPVAVSGVVAGSSGAGATGGGGSPTVARLRGQSLEVPEGVAGLGLGVVGGGVEGVGGAAVKQNGAAASSGGVQAKDGPEGVEKRDSLGRSGARVAARKPVDATGVRQSLYTGKKGSAGSLKEMVGQQAAQHGEEQKPRGVELVDKPMDD